MTVNKADARSKKRTAAIVATREVGQTIGEVKFDMYGNTYIVTEPASGFVQYLQPDNE